MSQKESQDKSMQRRSTSRWGFYNKFLTSNFRTKWETQKKRTIDTDLTDIFKVRFFNYQSMAYIITKDGPKAPTKEMSALSFQCCDWPTWLWRARMANHSTESRGLRFQLLFILSQSPWPVLLDHTWLSQQLIQTDLESSREETEDVQHHQSHFCRNIRLL